MAGSRLLPADLSLDESRLLASSSWTAILSGQSPSDAFPRDRTLPDVLYALSEALTTKPDYEPQVRQAVGFIYTFLERRPVCLPDDDEWQRLCARFAYVAWALSRRARDYVAMNRWEQVCEKHVVAGCDLQEFLGLATQDRDVALIDRFLRSPEDVLAACRWQRYEANANPKLASAFTIRVYESWVSRPVESTPEDERVYIAGELALAVARGYRLLERTDDTASWIQVARSCYSKSSTYEIGSCKLDLLGLQILYDRYQYATILKLVPRVAKNMERFALTEDLLRCRFMEALSLKDCGRLEHALAAFASLIRTPGLAGDCLLYGLSIATTAEILAAQGKTLEALRVLLTAKSAIEHSKVSWAMANYQGILAEILRDSGRLNEAIDGYESAAQLFSSAGIATKAAYMIVLLAETMMLVGRGAEAVPKLLAALSVLERDSPRPAISTAVALLRETLRRQEADPEALRDLRFELQAMMERSES